MTKGKLYLGTQKEGFHLPKKELEDLLDFLLGYERSPSYFLYISDEGFFCLEGDNENESFVFDINPYNEKFDPQNSTVLELRTLIMVLFDLLESEESDQIMVDDYIF